MIDEQILSPFLSPIVDTESISGDFIPAHYFKTKYNLRGRDWIRYIDPADRKALCLHAYKCSNYGRNGGKERASKALRDNRGRFIKEKNETTNSN